MSRPERHPRTKDYGKFRDGWDTIWGNRKKETPKKEKEAVMTLTNKWGEDESMTAAAYDLRKRAGVLWVFFPDAPDKFTPDKG